MANKNVKINLYTLIIKQLLALKSLWFLILSGFFFSFMVFFLIGSVAQKLFHFTGSIQLSDLPNQYLRSFNEYLTGFVADDEIINNIKKTPYLTLMAKFANVIAFPLVLPAIYSRILAYNSKDNLKKIYLSFVSRNWVFLMDFFILLFFAFLYASVDWLINLVLLSNFDLGIVGLPQLFIPFIFEKFFYAFLTLCLCMFLFQIVQNELFSTFFVFMIAFLGFVFAHSETSSLMSFTKYLLPFWCLDKLWLNGVMYFPGIFYFMAYCFLYFILAWTLFSKKDF